MKLEPVTKLDKGNKTTSKRTDDDAMSVIVIFSIFLSIWSQITDA